ncbi:DNA repair protein RadA [Gynuella sunshinyii]|uniref:DNA repair protein RadA n=1 Tax=Gynuella sunshinyii YC6258 TaxID=1445510 RepID=A0A0C5VU28_9GAMM|nr:DNA repair protein RadA [Gynuella sunshinyii]AJQ93879.1 putative ATP-dependent serine protease [Gynuella sunshinyii YC6258]
MAKAKLAFVCTDCGASFSKWQGQCAECKAWNTLTEFKEASGSKSRSVSFNGYSGQLSKSVQLLSEVDLADQPRFTSGMEEFDRVLGGGIVKGSVILVGGHPGAGKSTLLLQTMCVLAEQRSALYVTGEESLQQVALRANRLRLPVQKLKMLSETNVEAICQVAQELKPDIMVVDSIQVMHVPDVESAPGSVSQVREAAAWLTRFAKQTGSAVFIVGHVTKDGSLAGPKVLEHMIDCSIMLESSGDTRFRTLRGIKNRFGAVNELGVFAMLDSGMREVKNPSSIFLNRASEPAPGSLVTIIWEGTRPLLVEIQALVDESPFGNPRRVAVGQDSNRLAMLLAVLNRHGGVFTGDQDVFLNVVGGVRIGETGADLAVLLAILSSLRDRALPQDLVVFGELGLSGELRPVPSGQERVQEAIKHGFKRIILPAANKPKKVSEDVQLWPLESLQQVLEVIADL